jgi:heptose I phosphotransferase
VSLSNLAANSSWQRVGGTGSSTGTFYRRLVRGSRWTWIDERFRAALPADLEQRVMTLESRDRYHAKQGRSTARVVFHAGSKPLSVYLKRHFRLPWQSRLAALIDPAGAHSPGAAEWLHLNRVRALGIAVPEVVAAGERIGPWGRLQSFLMIADLVDSQPLHEAIPVMARRLDRRTFAAWKRRLVAALAEITAILHRANLFHKDLYLCHFFLEAVPCEHPSTTTTATTTSDVRLTLIDLHRLAHHPAWPLRWRWKDLGELLFSTYGVEGIDDRDRIRFWRHYKKQLGLTWPGWQARMIALKAARYRAHNAQ